jgi:hypothetical protein
VYSSRLYAISYMLNAEREQMAPKPEQLTRQMLRVVAEVQELMGLWMDADCDAQEDALRELDEATSCLTRTLPFVAEYRAAERVSDAAMRPPVALETFTPTDDSPAARAARGA